MEYIIGAIGTLVCCYVFDLCYDAHIRRNVKKCQEVWDKTKATMIENRADYNEIADEFLSYIAMCGCCCLIM